MRGQRKHSRARVLVIALATAVTLVAAGAAVWSRASLEVRKTHEDSAVASLSAGVTVYLADHPRVIEGLSGAPEGKWYVLSDREYDQIIPRVRRVHQLDVDPKRDSTKPLLDGWGNRYVIAVRVLRTGEADVVVFSKGPDGRLFTDDDLVRPHDRHVIRENDIDRSEGGRLSLE
jgi:hypothetical protein